MNERVRQILGVVLEMPEHEIDENLSAEDTSNWDSIRTLNLALELEKEFGISFSSDEIPRLSSYQAIVEALGQHGVA
jgi:acyl carrier protein